jgi:chromosome partitioning protein
MPILLLINLKGGVAKTTNAVAIAECLASEGYRTLLIDADHQCMASEMVLGENRLVKADRTRTTLHDLLAAMLDDEFEPHQIGQFFVPGVSNIGGGLRTLSVMPCSVRIDDFSTNMAKARRGYHSNDEFLEVWKRRRQQFQKWLSDNSDFTIVDCPPSMALQVRFFLPVADGFIIPSVPDRLSVRGSLYLLDRLGKLGCTRIKGIGTLWSLYREQNHVHREIVERSNDGDVQLKKLPLPFETVVPNATAIADATDPKKTPATFKAKYTPPFAKIFTRLCEEIVTRTQWQRVTGKPAVREKTGTMT